MKNYEMFREGLTLEDMINWLTNYNVIFSCMYCIHKDEKPCGTPSSYYCRLGVEHWLEKEAEDE